MNKPIIVLVVDAEKRRVRVEHTTRVDFLRFAQGIVGGFIERVTLEVPVAGRTTPLLQDCYVDEEGMLKGPKAFFELPWYPTPIAGNAVICGNVGPNVASVKIALRDVRRRVKFYDDATMALLVSLREKRIA